MRDSAGNITYGGIMRSRWNPLGINRISPTDSTVRVDTLHGNFVFVPMAIARQLEGIDGTFRHHMADIDYGARATKEGFFVTVLPGTYGECEFGPAVNRTFFQYWTFYFSVRGGGHWPTRVIFLKKHSTTLAIPLLLLMDALHFVRYLRAALKNSPK